MGIIELDLHLTENQKAIRDSARKFLREVWRPASVELDRLSSPEDVVAEGSVLWDVLRKTYELGYHRMAIPEALGGVEVDPLSLALVTEEMGWASPGLAGSWGVCTTPFVYASLSPHPEVHGLARAFAADTSAKMTGCWAITEPNHGSDWLLLESPGTACQVWAVPDGDHYVINGQKAAWVSNGTIANHAALFLSLDRSKGMGAGKIAVFPLDLPGVSRGKPLDKMGQRDLNQGEIYFDEVRIPRSHMVCDDPETYKLLIHAQLAGANAWMGCCFAGVAHSAFDEALRYSRERVQGGKVIAEHQNIQLKLFDMFTSVEASRSLARRVWVYNAEQARAGQAQALEYSTAAKVLSTESAFRVASQAVQIFGGNGLSKEYVIEKIFRDARASLIQDGVNETLALGGAARL